MNTSTAHYPAVLQAFVLAGVAVLTTEQTATAIGLAPQTLRKWACYDKAPHGIRPVKIGRAVRWRIEDVAVLLGGAA